MSRQGESAARSRAISLDGLAFVPLSARLQRDLDALFCGQRIVHAARATPARPPSDLLDSMPGASPASAYAKASSLSVRPSMHSGRSRELRLKSFPSLEREDLRRPAGPSIGQLQSLVPVTARHVSLRGCDASLRVRILPPGSMAICLLACLSLRSQLFVFQA